MKSIIVIPARFKSSRFPGKPLAKILDKPMIQWVAELSAKVVSRENVYIATENTKIFNAVTELGYEAIMTSEKCLTGTDRLAEIAKKVKADILFRVTSENPFIYWEGIDKLIKNHIEENFDLSFYGSLPLGASYEIINLKALEFAL